MNRKINKVGSSMGLEYILYDPRNWNKEDWQRYHEFRKIRFAETNPDDPSRPDEMVEKSIIQDYTNGLSFIERYMITDTDASGKFKIIGSLLIATFTEKDPSYTTNKHLALFDIALLKEYRKKGLGTQALPYIMNFAKIHDITNFISNVSEKDGIEFLQHIGATLALASKENRLQFNEVNWDMVREWITEGETLNKTTKLIACTEIPEDLIERYAPFFTEVNNQVPLGELDIDTLVTTPELIRLKEAEFKELGLAHHTMITLEADGEISGMTEMILRNTILSQGLTGVRASQRGRKLGKWLKAAMLEEMRKKYPQVKVITTGNADSNAPMLSINHRLGFKSYKEINIGQITLAKMEQYYTDKKHESIGK